MNTVLEKRTLKELRQYRKLSRPALALLLDVSKQSIWLWETGRKRPGGKTTQKLCELYGVDVREIRWD